MQQRRSSSSKGPAALLSQLEEKAAPEPHEIELQRKIELLQKVRGIRDRAIMYRGLVQNMDPNKVYVWVNMHESRQTWFQSLGYVLCIDPTVTTQWKKEDGTHRRGDLILYECPRDLYEALKLDSQLRGIEALESSKEIFKSFAEQSNIPLYSPEERS